MQLTICQDKVISMIQYKCLNSLKIYHIKENTITLNVKTEMTINKFNYNKLPKSFFKVKITVRM